MNDLIRNVSEVICNGLNTYMQNLNSRSEPWVLLGNINGNDGTSNTAASNKLVMSLYNVTRETTVNTYNHTVGPARNPGNVEALAVVSPPLYVDLHIMFMANFTDKNYASGLTALSLLISYFQQRPGLNHSNSPDLNDAIVKLNIDFENLSTIDVNYIMSMMGIRYLPSAFYKVRMLPFVANAMQERSFAVTNSSLQTGVAE